MSDIKKSTFYGFLNRYQDNDFDTYLQNSVENENYIAWHNHVLPMVYGDEEAEYNAVRNSCAIFDASPVRKYRFTGDDAGAFLDYLLTRPVSTMKEMRAAYVSCYEIEDERGTEDGATLYAIADGAEVEIGL